MATFSVSDEDTSGITVDFANGTNTEGYYAISGNTVVLTAAGEAFLDAGNTLPNVSVTTSTGVTQTNTVTTTLINDATLLSITDGSAIEDTTTAGTVMATFSVSDEDTSGITVDFASGTNTEGYYAISGNTVVLTAAGEAFLDAGNTRPNVSVTTSTGVTQTNTVTTTLINDATLLSITDGSAIEDTTTAGTVMATFSVSDEDTSGITVDFASGTNTEGYYAISGNTVVLTAAGEAFLDAGNTLPNVSVTTSTGVTQTNTVTATLINDATLLSITDGSAIEDTTTAGTVMATFSVSEEDTSGITVDFASGTNTEGYYAISGNT